MVLSSETLSILKNFATINASIVIEPGNDIRVLSQARNIYAIAVVQETFPVQCAIYDMNSLLSILTLADKQEINFGNDSMKINNPYGVFEYIYSDASLFGTPPKVRSLDHDEVFNFELAADDIRMITKAAAIINAPTLKVDSTSGGIATLQVSDLKQSQTTKTSNSFTREIGESDRDFHVSIAIENLKILPGDYDVSVARSATNGGKTKFLYFNHRARSLQYWIACEPGSTA